MIEDRSHLLSVSSRMGLWFGLYWVVKYLCILFVFDVPLLILLYLPLTIAVPFVGYKMTRRYRDMLGSDRPFSFLHGWQFGTLLYLFASIIVSIPHYFFYASILPQNITAYMAEHGSDMRGMLGSQWTLIEQSVNATLAEPPMNLVFNDITTNVFWGIIISLIVALILRRKPEDVKPVDNEVYNE